MDSRRLTGPGAGAVKYDIITALSVAGLNGDSGFQISMMRLISLITARYNWKHDTLTIGQREMAHLWGVGDRTAKREVKRWLDAGLLICAKPGVRGRVAMYRLNIARICEISADVWDQVGPDFSERMTAVAPREERVIRLETVRAAKEPRAEHGAGGWSGVCRRLEERFPSQYNAWIAPLRALPGEGEVILEARSAFAAEYIKTHFGRDICDAVHAEWGAPIRVVIRGESVPKRL